MKSKVYRQFGTTLCHEGITPIVKINLKVGSCIHEVALKLEGENPCGSIKDRTARSLVENLEKQNILSTGATIVESTSGNLGVALSYLASIKGYNFIAVIDPKTSSENIEKMSKFGAQIEMVNKLDATGGYLLSRLERIHELCSMSGQFIWTNQYSNQANPLAHYSETGPEILMQMAAKVDMILIAVSTGGTLAGISRYFRKISPLTKIVAVDVYGSVAFGGTPGKRQLTGIGSSKKSDFITPDLYDDCVFVSDEEAFSFCRALHSSTNIKVGGSSGAVLAACTKYLRNCSIPMENIVCVCPDRGSNYDGTIYNDSWLIQQGFTVSGSAFSGLFSLNSKQKQDYS